MITKDINSSEEYLSNLVDIFLPIEVQNDSAYMNYKRLKELIRTENNEMNIFKQRWKALKSHIAEDPMAYPIISIMNDLEDNFREKTT